MPPLTQRATRRPDLAASHGAPGWQGGTLGTLGHLPRHRARPELRLLEILAKHVKLALEFRQFRFDTR